MTGLLSRDDLGLPTHCKPPLPGHGGRKVERTTGLGATSTIILLIFAGQRVSPPERHEVDASGASSF